jgi:hypothetical protein
MARKVPKRIATSIINSLKGGVVPRVGLEYVAVGRKLEIEALLHDVENVTDGGASFRFIVGKYGSGKSFLLQTIRNYSMDKNMVVIDADLSPERKLSGTRGQGLATYRELIKNMSTKTKPDGGALPLILEKWISKVKAEVLLEKHYDGESQEFISAVNTKIYEVLNNVESLVNGFDFAKVISIYWKACIDCNDDTKSCALRWLRAEYSTKSQAKQDLGISIIITDDNWYDYIKVFALFLVKAGYSGMLILIDELENLYKISNSITRQNNYEKLLAIYNDALQGKAEYIGIIMGGTPRCIEDNRRGLFSYEALKSRLDDGKFTKEGQRDLFAPIIRLEPLISEEMYVLIEKLSTIHTAIYDYDCRITQNELISFLEIEYKRIGANNNITPREVIRDFIELLNIAFQNPNKTIIDIMGTDQFEFNKNEVDEEEIDEEFAEFEV